MGRPVSLTTPTTRFSPMGEERLRLEELLEGSTLLVTGGTGTFGHALVTRLLERTRPGRILVFSRDELKQSEMQCREPFRGRPEMRWILGDVRDVRRLETVMRGVDFVVHAAALKQIPAAEHNPLECIQTNVLGAQNVVEAALSAGVQRVIALSTDKAVNPVNLYGASKLAADKIFLAARHMAGPKGPLFSVVRYGNVLGSRGSVVPLYRRLMAEDADYLPLTDARMTRFWITPHEAADFVLSSLVRMHGGEIFVPRLPSMLMSEMASTLAPHLPQRVVGMRAGEKIHEVMLTEDEVPFTADQGDRFVVLADAERCRDLGAALPADFRYSSETNTDRLTPDSLLRLLEEAGA